MPATRTKSRGVAPNHALPYWYVLERFARALVETAMALLRHIMRACHPYGLVALTLCVVGCLEPISPSYEGTALTSPRVTNLADRVDDVINNVLHNRELTQGVHAAWQVVHGILAYGDAFPLETPNGRESALDYLLKGGELKGWLFAPGDQLADGRTGLRSIMESGTYVGQGHADQWLAVLAQADLGLDQPIRVQGKTYSMKDFLEQVQRDVPYNSEQEWSWTLIGLTRYIPTSETWTASDGDTWSVERLVGKELEQVIETSACGGTHRLIGISMALNKRRAEGGKIDSLWRRAEDLVMNAADIARQFQNGDGSFSTNYFQRPGISADSANLLATTGHTLEFLALTLSPDQLREPWVVKSVNRLCELLEDAEEMPLECGALYHAVHGLVVYRDRVLADS